MVYKYTASTQLSSKQETKNCKSVLLLSAGEFPEGRLYVHVFQTIKGHSQLNSGPHSQNDMKSCKNIGPKMR